MTDIHQFLAGLWYLLLCAMLMLYVISDGFDLGVGMLSLLDSDEDRRAAVTAAVGGIRDANESWLLLFGAGLFGAFPNVYAVTLRALYIPVGVMLFGLILRAVSFEFLGRARDKGPWSLAFGAGSLVAAVAQGYALGAVIGGLPVVHGGFAGSGWSWLGPFSSVVAVGVVAGYALLGGAYLVARTGGDLQDRYRKRSRLAAWVTLCSAAVVTVAVPLMHDYVAQRWFSLPNIFFLLVLLCLALLVFVGLMQALRNGRAYAPFVWSLLLFVTAFIGLAASLYPYLIPPTITIAEAASSGETLLFMLVGIGMLIPVMLIYNGYQHIVFRGSMPPGPRPGRGSRRGRGEVTR
ncbi:MAG: cytochrome d ubiquinol oxidase subunit II [Thiogranum sp.]